MNAFAHTSFLLCQTMTNLYELVNKQKVFMLINLKPNQCIFHRVIDVIMLLMHFAHTMFLLCQTIFLKIQFLNYFEKSCLPPNRRSFIVSFQAKN